MGYEAEIWLVTWIFGLKIWSPYFNTAFALIMHSIICLWNWLKWYFTLIILDFSIYHQMAYYQTCLNIEGIPHVSWFVTDKWRLLLRNNWMDSKSIIELITFLELMTYLWSQPDYSKIQRGSGLYYSGSQITYLTIVLQTSKHFHG